MICFPNAKINIGLFVTEKREDGYHNLETIFYPINIKDALEFREAPDMQMHVHGLAVSGEQKNNLVWKAWELLKQAFPEKVNNVHIHLLKNIPMGAGMGGGSADAAFMLALMNQYFDLGLNKNQLAAYALSLGSDCPFFIYNEASFASGRGELLQASALDLSNYSLQIICPKVHITTAEAFKNIKPKKAVFDLREIVYLPISQWREYIFNDFEESVFAHHPALAEIKAQLYAGGALYAAMSGTGSTIYGIFEKGKKATIQSSLDFLEY